MNAVDAVLLGGIAVLITVKLGLLALIVILAVRSWSNQGRERKHVMANVPGRRRKLLLRH